MSAIQIARRWAQDNPQLATNLLALAAFAGVGAATGDFASWDGATSGWDPSGGTSSWQGP
jgi:hypothetical protein